LLILSGIEYSNEILKELKSVFNLIQEDEIKLFVDEILKAKTIFLTGAGRSGLCVKAFAMRLMHLGYKVYIVGEIVTRSLQKGDLLIVGSGSGGTATVSQMANKAKKIGARIAILTMFPDSVIGNMADCIVEIPSPESRKAGDLESIQLEGTLFEQSMFLVLEFVILKLMKIDNLSDDNMNSLHANLE
jgi:6-phospho-3-hexuloisomerase